GQVALVQYPSFARATVTHLQLVALDARRVLVIIVTDTGRVSQRLTVLEHDIDEESLDRILAGLQPMVAGRLVGEAADLAARAQSQAVAAGTAESAIAAI